MTSTWLADPATLPAGWDALRLRFGVRVNPSARELHLAGNATVSFVPMDAIGQFGGLTLKQERSIDEVGNGYTYFADGDVIVAKITPCFENGKGALAEGLANGIAFGTTEIHVLRPTNSLDPRYLFYLTISEQFRKLGEAFMYGAGGQKRVPDLFIKDLVVPLPPADKQRAIAAFLDERTAQIDALIAKKERLLALLSEKREAITTRAVTKGLDPKPPVKDTGIPWLGEIPAHWSTCQLKFGATVYDCKHITPTYVADGLPLISTSEVRPYHLIFSPHRQVTQEDFMSMTEGGRDPRSGDIIYSRNASLGAAARVRATDSFCMGQDICLLRPHAFISEFLEHVLNCSAFSSHLDSLLLGSTIRRINVESIRQYPLPVPPKDEQNEICASLLVQMAPFYHAINKIRSGIDTLQRYRCATITSAVRGQLDTTRCL